MALIIDERARAAIARRRAGGREARLFLRVEPLPARGGFSHMLAVDWVPRRWLQRAPTARQVGDVTVYIDQRLARYTQWADVTLSAWRLGPLEWVVVARELLVLLEMEEWEHAHPPAARLVNGGCFM